MHSSLRAAHWYRQKLHWHPWISKSSQRKVKVSAQLSRGLIHITFIFTFSHFFQEIQAITWFLGVLRYTLIPCLSDLTDAQGLSVECLLFLFTHLVDLTQLMFHMWPVEGVMQLNTMLISVYYSCVVYTRLFLTYNWPISFCWPLHYQLLPGRKSTLKVEANCFYWISFL